VILIVITFSVMVVPVAVVDASIAAVAHLVIALVDESSHDNLGAIKFIVATVLAFPSTIASAPQDCWVSCIHAIIVW
jgi:hypothetical protein